MTDLSKELSDLASMDGRTRRAAAHIETAALQRREEVERRLAELRCQVLSDAAAATEYQALVLERGRLDRVLASGT